VADKNSQPYWNITDAHHAGMEKVTVAPSPYPEPHPFVWFPLEGKRHAIDRHDRNVPRGAPMHCLCGATHPRGPDSDLEGTIWPTCPQCWDQACIIVGLRPGK
jgi:hypothetical protein